MTAQGLCRDCNKPTGCALPDHPCEPGDYHVEAQAWICRRCYWEAYDKETDAIAETRPDVALTREAFRRGGMPEAVREQARQAIQHLESGMQTARLVEQSIQRRRPTETVVHLPKPVQFVQGPGSELTHKDRVRIKAEQADKHAREPWRNQRRPH